MDSSVVLIYICVFVFFFFKQKTAYEMRISDWSSDVCSSDLRTLWHHPGDAQNVGRARRAEGNAGGDDDAVAGLGEAVLERVADRPDDHVAEVPGILGVDAVHAPDDGEPPRRRQVGRQADNR